jgi:hypothetical protein
VSPKIPVPPKIPQKKETSKMFALFILVGSLIGCGDKQKEAPKAEEKKVEVAKEEPKKEEAKKVESKKVEESKEEKKVEEKKPE